MRRLLLVLAIVLCAAPRSAHCADTFLAGQTSRVFHPEHPRNWRLAKTHALISTVWYPVTPAAGVEEKPQYIGSAKAPDFLAGSAAVGAPLAASPAKFPVVLLSHGTGGSASQLGWLGPELARHGYIAVAVNHPGNNGLEPYTAEGFTLWWERATDLSDALTELVADPTFGPHVDQTRVGAAGFSIGGYTVLALAGARVNQQKFIDACTQSPELPTCHVPEMRTLGDMQHVLATVRLSSAQSLTMDGASYRDSRIRAVFAISPAVGQAFTAKSFRDVQIPVALVVGADDPIAPPATNAAYFKQLYPKADLTVLPGVVHYTFLDTCAPAGTAAVPYLCQDAPGVDRAQVHAKVVALALDFFDKNLQ
jgi:predicted dienelactone hydrolase